MYYFENTWLLYGRMMVYFDTPMEKITELSAIRIYISNNELDMN